MFASRFGIVHENLFNYFLETATEISTRIHIDPKTGTVAKGQLWTEEALPAETVTASLVWVDKIRESAGVVTKSKIIEEFCTNEVHLQVGGKATVGRGRVRATFNGN